MLMINRKRIRNAFKYFLAEKQDHLADKAGMSATIEKYAVDGQVALVVWQMDCDCSSWTSKVLVKATVVHVGKALDNIYNGAEGPVRWHIDNPSVVVNRNSRDHALEAYEDGHAHSVSY